MLASVIGLYVVSASHGDAVVPALRPAGARHRPRHAEAGCSSASSSRSRSRPRCSRSTPGWPTPPSRRRPARACCWSACSTRSAPTACCASAWGSSRRLAVGDAGRDHPRPDLDRVRRAGRDRPGRHPAPDRSDLAEPLRLHRARHLRVHQPGRLRRDPLHGQPRHRHRGAVPRRRLPDPAPRHRLDPRRWAASRRSPRCWPGCSWSSAWPPSACPACRRSSPRSW